MHYRPRMQEGLAWGVDGGALGEQGGGSRLQACGERGEKGRGVKYREGLGHSVHITL